LIPTVTGKFLLIDGAVFLIATIQLQNVGLSRIAFDQKGSSVVVFEYVPSQIEEIPSVKSNLLTSFRVFGDKDRYIEPNEIVVGQLLTIMKTLSRVGDENT
jgi:hypothetical protein